MRLGLGEVQRTIISIIAECGDDVTMIMLTLLACGGDGMTNIRMRLDAGEGPEPPTLTTQDNGAIKMHYGYNAKI